MLLAKLKLPVWVNNGGVGIIVCVRHDGVMTVSLSLGDCSDPWVPFESPVEASEGGLILAQAIGRSAQLPTPAYPARLPRQLAGVWSREGLAANASRGHTHCLPYC